MNELNKIDPLDEALRLLYLETAADGNMELFKAQVAQEPLQYRCSPEQKAAFAQATGVEQASSFGALITEAMGSGSWELETLAGQVAIPADTLHQLQQDAVFTNQIPVMHLKQLLHVLNIPFEAAKNGIVRTFELLKSIGTSASAGTAQLAYRKAGAGSRKSASPRMEVNRASLFENREALDRYLNRLEVLIDKDAKG